MSLLYPLSSGLRVSAQKRIRHGGIGTLRCAIKNSWNAQGTLPPSSQLYMPVLFKIRPLKYHGSTKARGPECRIIKVFLKNCLCSENCKTRASIHAIPYNLYGKYDKRHRCLEIAAGLGSLGFSYLKCILIVHSLIFLSTLISTLERAHESLWVFQETFIFHLTLRGIG